MRSFAIILFLAMLAPAAQAKAQPTPKEPPQLGYVTEDGKRYGNCRNHHHRPHKHCKELVPLPKPKAAPVKQQPAPPPADAKIIRP